MELDKLAAEILQQFPELKDLKRPDLFTIAKAIRKLGWLKNKELKESAKQEKRDQRKAKRLAKQEAEKNISTQKEKEDIVAQQEEEKRQEALREQKEKITKLIEETTDEPVKTRLLGIKKKWETRNAAKLEKVKEKLLAKLHKLKSAKIKQNALDRMDSTLLKAEIALNKKLEKRLTGIKEKACSKKSAKATTKQEKREAKKKAKEEKERKKIAAQKKKEEEIKNRTEAVKIIVERIEQLINGAADESIRKKLSVSKQSWEARNTAKLKNLEKELSAKIHDVKSPKAKQNVLDRTSRILSETKIKLYDRLEKRLKGIKKTSEKNRSEKLAETKLRLEKVSESKKEVLTSKEHDSKGMKPKRSYVRRQQTVHEPMEPQLEKKVKDRSETKRRNKKTQKDGGNGTNTVSFIFSRISKRLLRREEETVLSNRIQNGDKKAIDELILMNQRLVINKAKKYVSASGVPLEDLIGYGNIGLIKAAERFKSKKNCKFSTYAMYWIRAQIERGLMEGEGEYVRLPIHLQVNINKMQRIFRELNRELGREPEIKELADRSEMSEKKICELQKLAIRSSVKLEDPVGNGEDKSDQGHKDVLKDTTIPPHAEEIERLDSQTHLKKEVWEGLNALEEIERDILIRRFGEEKFTLEQIGKDYNVTRERIRQIETNALKKISAFFKKTGKEELLRELIA